MFRWRSDKVLAPVLAFFASASGALLLLVLAFLGYESWPAFANGGWLSFLGQQGWYPSEGKFGILPMWWASLAAALGAVLLATPLGVGCAIFVNYYAPTFLKKPYQLMLSLLAGIPSVVFGLWGLTILVPLIALWQAPGASLLAAIVVLTLMILPTIALTSLSSFSAIAPAWLQGAAALGMSRKGIIFGVALPAAKQGISSGILLAIARALGETMAVLMVAGNVVQNPTGLFEPVRVLTANIALEMAYATGIHRAGLFASGLLLMLLVLVLSGLAIRQTKRVQHG